MDDDDFYADDLEGLEAYDVDIAPAFPASPAGRESERGRVVCVNARCRVAGETLEGLEAGEPCPTCGEATVWEPLA
jgi:hypothetical protein